MKALITAEHITLVLEGESILHELSFTIEKGECLVITGPSGSGKTMLGKLLAGHYPVSSGILTTARQDLRRVFVHQQHDFRFAFQARSYFGQRFDRNYGQEFPTVYKILSKGIDSETELQQVIQLLKLEEKLQQPIIELSNGEGKRVQLAQALLLQPQLLILDQPFIGLDTATRAALHELLSELKAQGITIVLITTEDEIPTVTDRVLALHKGMIHSLGSASAFLPQQQQQAFSTSFDYTRIQSFSKATHKPFDTAVQMNNVNIRFDDIIILNNISWTVKRGEHWALIGHNGSGKSTLLSLINADNPQVYLNDVYLFDQKRGSGESIWEIKQKIGYVSPEMHNQFQRSSTYVEAISMSSNDYSLSGFSQDQTSCYEVVCSGFNDQVGSSARISELQHQQVRYWMEALDISHLSKKAFHKASLGEQRLLLLARALVKNPPLLILDEPCQGLDKQQTKLFTSVVDNICNHIEKTLIYVSHYDHEMPACIDHKLVLERGRVKLSEP